MTDLFIMFFAAGAVTGGVLCCWIVARWWRDHRRCASGEHDWFPGRSASEFVPVTVMCIRCSEKEYLLPWGDCLRHHPLADHYKLDGGGELIMVPAGGCRVPL